MTYLGNPATLLNDVVRNGTQVPCFHHAFIIRYHGQLEGNFRCSYNDPTCPFSSLESDCGTPTVCLAMCSGLEIQRWKDGFLTSRSSQYSVIQRRESILKLWLNDVWNNFPGDSKLLVPTARPHEFISCWLYNITNGNNINKLHEPNWL